MGMFLGSFLQHVEETIIYIKNRMLIFVGLISTQLYGFRYLWAPFPLIHPCGLHIFVPFG